MGRQHRLPAQTLKRALLAMRYLYGSWSGMRGWRDGGAQLRARPEGAAAGRDLSGRAASTIAQIKLKTSLDEARNRTRCSAGCGGERRMPLVRRRWGATTLDAGMCCCTLHPGEEKATWYNVRGHELTISEQCRSIQQRASMPAAATQRPLPVS
jgi:hypothetical protein